MSGNGKPKQDALVSLLETMVEAATRMAATIKVQADGTQAGFDAIAERIGLIQTMVAALAEALARLDGRVSELESRPYLVDARAKDRS